MKTMISFLHKLLLFFVFFPVTFFTQAFAQTQVTALPVNASATVSAVIKACADYRLSDVHYDHTDVVAVQTNLEQIYHEGTAWRMSFREKSHPLNDGVMGEVTWSWAQRFCNNFSLGLAPDAISEIPVRLNAIAHFSQVYRDDANVLISDLFLRWVEKNPRPCELDANHILYRGSDSQLLELLKCYRQPKPEPVVTTVHASSKPNSIYVLRADDFVTLEKSTALIESIIALKNTLFIDADSANQTINTLLDGQPQDLHDGIAKIIQKNLAEVTSYQLTDKILDSLLNAGVGDGFYLALKKVPQTLFSSEKAFRTEIENALKSTAVILPAQSTSSQESSSVGNPNGESPADNLAATQRNDVNIARTIAASRKNGFMLTQEKTREAVTEIIATQKILALPQRLIDMLKGLQDIEYPEGELLHAAIQNKFVKGLHFCKLDNSNTLDVSVNNLTEAEKQQLAVRLALLFPSFDINAQEIQLCNESHVKNIEKDYNDHIRAAIEKIYRKDMPAFQPLPLQWDGNDCGCVPKEMTTMAYGIYPYWNATGKVQNYNFSTFSRVAYFGFSVNGNGQLIQINAQNQANTLLNNNRSDARQFISQARSYGSKVDWMIEKDWNEFMDENRPLSPGKINDILKALRLNIVALLNEPLKDNFSTALPWLSLGLQAHPTNGDGVTLYFKHYPTSDDAKKAFDLFFKTLKSDLNPAQHPDDKNPLRKRRYVNLVVTQDDFVQDGGIFSSLHLQGLLEMEKYPIQTKSQIEMQEDIKSLVLVLLRDPYYSSLDDIYASTSEPSRSVIVPVMFSDYSQMDIQTKNAIVRAGGKSDVRFKQLSYIHESFGGGGFWPMTTWGQKNMDGFNTYLKLQFAPGHEETHWSEKWCIYRWQIVAVMNIWLLLGLVFVLMVFYILPYHCLKLPPVVRFLTHPIAVPLLLMPPLVLWIYLLIVDRFFPVLTVTGFLCVLLVALSARAAYLYIKQLGERKPSRNLMYYPEAAAPAMIPMRTQEPSKMVSPTHTAGSGGGSTHPAADASSIDDE